MGRIRAVVLGCVVGCVPVGPELDTISQPASGCSVAVCGSNSPQIDHYGVFDFSINPARANAQGFVVLGLLQRGVAYDLVVRNSRFVGLQAGREVLTDYALAGSQIILARGATQYTIAIDGVGDVKEVVGPNDIVHTYALRWDLVVANPLGGPLIGGQPVDKPPIGAGKPAAVCPEAPEDFRAWEETDGLQKWSSIVFEGDRIDPVALTVAHRADDRWWNIGCNRHLLSKLRLTRNTIHTAAAWQYEQTAMKMLAAQYCIGSPTFTYSGEPLVWRNNNATYPMSFFDAPVDLEARWNENGALCLGSPRLERTTNPHAAIDYKNLTSDIAAACPNLPPCGELDPYVDDPKLLELATSGNYD